MISQDLEQLIAQLLAAGGVHRDAVVQRLHDIHRPAVLRRHRWHAVCRRLRRWGSCLWDTGVQHGTIQLVPERRASLVGQIIERQDHADHCIHHKDWCKILQAESDSSLNMGGKLHVARFRLHNVKLSGGAGAPR